MSLIDIFSEISRDNLPIEETLAQMKNSISSQERYDGYIEQRLGGIYPEAVQIANTPHQFSFFPICKSLPRKLSRFDDICEITKQQGDDEGPIKSFFNADNCNLFNRIYINIFIDFQLANPLLSKKACFNEMKAVYYRVVTRKSDNFSKRNSIQLLSLCKTSVFKSNPEIIMSYIARDFNSFKDSGINLIIGGINYHLNLEIGFFSLDSKEASYQIGLKQSFNHNYCCRTCLVPRSVFNTTFHQNDEALRTPESYQIHLASGLIDPESEECFGIQRQSLLRHFDSLNVVFKSPPCIGHDFFEGVAPKILNLIFRKLVDQRKITEYVFNQRVNDLNLTYKDKYSFPTINFSAPNLRLTMNESFYLLRFLPFLLYESVNHESEESNFILMLCEISRLIMRFQFTLDQISYLDNLISDFLRKCVQIFPDCTLTIKFHHMTHYAGAIFKFGPLRLLSTINFESHHSFLKTLMRPNRNWIRPSYSIAKAYARFSSVDRITDSSVFKPEPFFMLDTEVKAYYPENTVDVLSYNLLELYGVDYRIGHCIFYSQINNESFFLKLDKICRLGNDFSFFGGIMHGNLDETRNCYHLNELNSKAAILYSQINQDFFCYTIYLFNLTKIIFLY